MSGNKRGPLSRSEIYYILQNPDELSIDNLAKELNRSVPQIEGILDKAKDEEKKEMNKNLKERMGSKTTTTTTRPETVTRTLMGRKKRNNQYVATVMTPAASQLGDDRNITPKGSKTKNNPSIFKPYGDE